MSRRAGWSMAMLLVASAVAPAFAQAPAPADWPVEILTGAAKVQQFRVVDRLDLEPITLAELLNGGSPASSMGTWTSPASIDPSTGAFSSRVDREVDALWQARVRRQDRGNLSASYSLSGINGRPGVLSNSERPGAQMQTAIVSLPLEFERENKNFYIVTGGVRLIVDLAGAVASGTYSGTLTVTLNNL